MPDARDWYRFQPGSTRHIVGDLGELAARLGSPDVYDRRGEVVWMDIFDHGLSPWVTSLVGTGSAAEIVATNTDMGGYAIKLTGGSDGIRTATLKHQFSLTTLGKAGVEISIWITGAFEEFYLYLVRYDGTQLHKATIKLTWTGGLISYLNSANNWVDLVSGALWSHSDPRYDNIKLVVDMENDEYLRLLFNNDNYDISDIPIRVQASGLNPGYVMQVSLISRSGANDSLQLGRVIVTGNEP